jgi:RimJ/RimL family protein N-acetyltransferase
MKKEKNEVTLRTINKTDLKFLFEILEEREQKVNISHRKMPTFEQHKKFVASKPYSKWYVIFQGVEKVGSIYLSKQNEIGIFLKKGSDHAGIGTNALKLIMEKNPKRRYLANVNPKNKESIKFFKKNNFSILQHTYELNLD